MDPVQLVAERKIATALEEGLFENLPALGEIECSLHGEAFLAWWFRKRYGHDSLMEKKRDDVERPQSETEQAPENTTSGTGAVPEDGPPNPGFTARGD